MAEIVAGLMPTYLAFALMCPVIGFCTLTMLNSANATMQLESEPALRGRVMALYMTIVMGGTPIGSPIIGWVGQHFGPRWTLLGGGALMIVGVLLAIALLARLTRERGRGRTRSRRWRAQAGLTWADGARISFWRRTGIPSSLEHRVRLVRTRPRALLASRLRRSQTDWAPRSPSQAHTHQATRSCPARRRVLR